jgi:hypothetical protein
MLIASSSGSCNVDIWSRFVLCTYAHVYESQLDVRMQAAALGSQAHVGVTL